MEMLRAKPGAGGTRIPSGPLQVKPETSERMEKDEGGQ